MSGRPRPTPAYAPRHPTAPDDSGRLTPSAHTTADPPRRHRPIPSVQRAPLHIRPPHNAEPTQHLLIPTPHQDDLRAVVPNGSEHRPRSSPAQRYRTPTHPIRLTRPQTTTGFSLPHLPLDLPSLLHRVLPRPGLPPALANLPHSAQLSAEVRKQRQPRRLARTGQDEAKPVAINDGSSDGFGVWNPQLLPDQAGFLACLETQSLPVQSTCIRPFLRRLLTSCP